MEANMKFPSLSKMAREQFKDSSENRSRIRSILPMDRSDCDCFGLVDAYWQEAGKGHKAEGEITCPRSKNKGYTKYIITCANCGNPVAEVYAKDKTLSDYCNLHTISETDGEHWFGCFALNLSPIDGSIGIECSCGQDTRDFRANNTLPQSKLNYMIEKTSQGRNFGVIGAKYKVTKAKL